MRRVQRRSCGLGFLKCKNHELNPSLVFQSKPYYFAAAAMLVVAGLGRGETRVVAVAGG